MSHYHSSLFYWKACLNSVICRLRWWISSSSYSLFALPQHPLSSSSSSTPLYMSNPDEQMDGVEKKKGHASLLRCHNVSINPLPPALTSCPDPIPSCTFSLLSTFQPDLPVSFIIIALYLLQLALMVLLPVHWSVWPSVLPLTTIPTTTGQIGIQFTVHFHAPHTKHNITNFDTSWGKIYIFSPTTGPKNSNIIISMPSVPYTAFVGCDEATTNTVFRAWSWPSKNGKDV